MLPKTWKKLVSVDSLRQCQPATVVPKWICKCLFTIWCRCLCESMCTTHTREPARTRRGVGHPVTGVTAVWVPPGACWHPAWVLSKGSGHSWLLSHHLSSCVANWTVFFKPVYLVWRPNRFLIFYFLLTLRISYVHTTYLGHTHLPSPLLQQFWFIG